MFRLLCPFLLCFCGDSAFAQLTRIETLQEFTAIYPTHSLYNFDNRPAGTVGPIISVPMQISGATKEASPVIQNSLIGFGHVAFFGASASAPNWLLANDGLVFFWVPAFTGGAVEGFAFTISCFSCDNPGNPSRFRLEQLAPNGSVLLSQEFTVELTSSISVFFAVSSAETFSKLRFSRLPSVGIGFQNYLIDDVRFIYGGGRPLANGFE